MGAGAEEAADELLEFRFSADKQTQRMGRIAVTQRILPERRGP